MDKPPVHGAALDESSFLDISGSLVVSSCALMGLRGKGTAWESQYMSAIQPFCDDPALAPLVEVTVVPGFEKQFKRYYDKDGWVEKAWVNYVGVTGPKDKYG